VGLLPGLGQKAVFFGRVGTGPQVHFEFPPLLVPIKYLSSDRIMTWCIRRLCSSSRSFTSRFQNWDPTDISGVAVKKALISTKIRGFSTATQQILVRSQIWKREVKERPKLHNQRIHHIMIWSELQYLIWAKHLSLQRTCFEVETGPNANGPGFSGGKTVATVWFRFQP
jgi:hypothetical protein